MTGNDKAIQRRPQGVHGTYGELTKLLRIVETQTRSAGTLERMVEWANFRLYAEWIIQYGSWERFLRSPNVPPT